MRTALTAAEKNTLRTRPHAAEFFAAIHQPVVIWMGNFGGTLGYPASSITASGTTTGHLTDIKSGMTLRVGTDRGGNDLGTIRVRGSNSASSIFTAEYGSGLINWAASPWLTVVEEYRPWPIHHRFDSAASRWEVDFNPYTNELSRYGPIALPGPPTVVWIEGGKGLASYVGDRSYSMTIGASITTQSWAFANGQTVTSVLGSSKNPVVITYLNASSGGRYHTLTVTDGNGNSHIGQRLTFAFNQSTLGPIKVKLDQITGGLRRGGYDTRLYVDGSITATSAQFPDGAQVVVFERASYGGIASSLGGNFFGRNHVVMVGWIDGESVRIEPFTGEVSFRIGTIESELEKTQGYELFLENASAASTWTQASGLTVDRNAIALVKYRSTIANVTDFNFAESTASTNEMSFHSIPRGSLWEQLQYNYDDLFGLVAADLQSSLYAQMDAQVSGGSLGLPVVTDIAARDRRGQVTIDKVHQNKNSQFVVYAIQGNPSSVPVGALSPGDPVGYFGGRQETTRNKDVPSQDVLTTWAGNWRARENNPYKHTVVPLAGNYRLDPVPQSRVTMSLSALDVNNVRGINWSNKTFLPTDLSLTYDPLGGFVNTELTMEASVDGIGGSALTWPKVDKIVPANPPPSPPPPPPGGGGATGGLLYLVTTKKIGRTRNWNNSSPNWQDITGAVNVSSDSIRDFILDPYDPLNGAWLVTDTRIYRCQDLNGTFPTFTQVAVNTDFGSGYTLRRIKANITAQNRLIVGMTKVSGGSGAFHVARSTNGGSTWTAVIKVNDLTVNDRYIDANYAQLEWGQHSTNIVYTPFINNVTNVTGILKSTDGGDTWSDYTSWSENSGFQPTDVICPYEGNADDAIIWFLGNRGNPNIYRYDPTRGRVQSNEAGSATQDPAYGPYAIITYVYANAQRIYYYWKNNSTAKIYYTSDEGATWNLVQDNITANTSLTSHFMMGLWPYDSNRLSCVFHTGPTFSQDGGYNFASKLGDWNAVMGAWSNGTGIIAVPVWTSD